MGNRQDVAVNGSGTPPGRGRMARCGVRQAIRSNGGGAGATALTAFDLRKTRPLPRGTVPVVFRELLPPQLPEFFLRRPVSSLGMELFSSQSAVFLLQFLYLGFGPDASCHLVLIGRYGRVRCRVPPYQLFVLPSDYEVQGRAVPLEDSGGHFVNGYWPVGVSVTGCRRTAWRRAGLRSYRSASTPGCRGRRSQPFWRRCPPRPCREAGVVSVLRVSVEWRDDNQMTLPQRR